MHLSFLKLFFCAKVVTIFFYTALIVTFKRTLFGPHTRLCLCKPVLCHKWTNDFINPNSVNDLLTTYSIILLQLVFGFIWSMERWSPNLKLIQCSINCHILEVWGFFILGGVHVKERGCVCECRWVCTSVCEGNWICECLIQWEGQHVCVCVRERERERQKDRLCLKQRNVCVREGERVCVCMWVYVHVWDRETEK